MTDTNTLTYTENKDGTISVQGSEGNEVRYAKEADLLAVKGSAEAATKAAKEAQEAVKAEIETANTNLESTRQEKLQAEAKISSLEEKVSAGAGSTDELANVKQELEAAKKSGEELTNKALEYRKQIVVSTFGIPADTVKDKTMEQLDYYEEALKAVVAAKGIGNYAVGGGGGVGAAPLTPLDRAKQTIATAMEKKGIKV